MIKSVGLYQLRDSKTLALFTNKNHKFLPAWYDKYQWITLCLTKKKVLCINCRFAQSHKLLTFLKKADAAFIISGFSNYKKAIEKFEIHEKSDCHNEASVKIAFLKGPSISVQLNTQIARLQMFGDMVSYFCHRVYDFFFVKELLFMDILKMKEICVSCY